MAPGRRELFTPEVLRVAAAGSETTPVTLPLRVGLPVSAGDSLLVTAMLHNPTTEPYRGVRLTVRLHYTSTGPWTPPADVVPFGTHVTPSLEETAYDIPPGRSRKSLLVRPAVSGTVLALGGHLHRYGVSVRLEDAVTGERLWQTEARRAPDGTVLEVPHDILVWSGGVELRAGHPYRVTAVYDNPTDRTVPWGGMGTLAGILMPDGPWPEADPDAPEYRWSLERELQHEGTLSETPTTRGTASGGGS